MVSRSLSCESSCSNSLFHFAKCGARILNSFQTYSIRATLSLESRCSLFHFEYWGSCWESEFTSSYVEGLCKIREGGFNFGLRYMISWFLVGCKKKLKVFLGNTSSDKANNSVLTIGVILNRSCSLLENVSFFVHDSREAREDEGDDSSERSRSPKSRNDQAKECHTPNCKFLILFHNDRDDPHSRNPLVCLSLQGNS